jgi:nucleotide-binding universal stress UspA family protein
MAVKSVQHILCAIRGVPKSRATVSKAIDLALEHQARLTFLHVDNASFLITAGPTMTTLSKVYKHMRNLSEFTMLVLCDRAERRGVEEVDYLVREGEIMDQIQIVLREVSPDILVIGKPISNAEGIPSFNPPDFESFVQEMEQGFGVKVHTVEIELDE